MSVIDDDLPGGLVVHRVQESAHVVDHLVNLAQAHGFPFLDLTGADGMPLCVRTEHVRQISASEKHPTSEDIRETFQGITGPGK